MISQIRTHPWLLKLGLLAILPGLAFSQASQPRLFFSDIISGPNSGGQNNAGAFVALYGNNFGSSPTVTVGGGQAIIALAPASYLWYQKMTIQLGALAQSGNIVVSNSNGSSNPLPFTVRSGSIYFVATNGNDSNAGTYTSPWKTLPHGVQTSGAGAIVYAMNGVSQTGDDGEGWDAALTLRAEYCQGTAASPKALIGYPGATVTIGSPTGMSPGNGLRSVDFTANGGACGGNWVFAGLNFRGVSPVTVNGPSTNWRFIGNDISNPQADGGGGGGATWETTMASYVKCLGNYGHDMNLATTDRLQQGFYPSTDSNHAELGWNEIGNVGGRAAIQTHSSPVSSGNGYAMFDISIHDNRIHDVAGEGILIDTVDPSKGAVQIYNNVIWNTGRTQGGNAIYGATSSDFDTSQGVGSGYVDIFNNTIYDWKGDAGIGVWYEVHNGQSLYYRVRNNLIVSTGRPYWDPWKAGSDDSEWRSCTESDTQSSCPNFIGSNNLVLGNGAPTFTKLLTGTLTSDPLFVNASQGDFHLRAGSPAANGGTATPQTTDIDGVPLPQGAGYPIGAYALAGGGGTPVVSVSVSPASASLSGGQTRQFTATVSGTSNTAVTWSVSPAVGAVSSSGLYTAPATIATQQTVTVKATSVADSSKSASAMVTLNPPPVITMSVSPASSSLSGGKTQQFAVTVTGSPGYTTCNWSVSPAVGTISSSGLYTAPATIGAQQTLTVKAALTSDSTKFATATVTLNPPTAAVTISVSPASSSRSAGQTQQFTAAVGGTSNTAVTWSVSPAIGTISGSGLYTAPTTIGAQQTVTVRATSVADSTKSATATVTLNPPAAVVTISVSPASSSRSAGQTQQFTATVGGASNTSVTWSVSPAVGTISASGLYTAPATCSAQQTVTVRATSVADSTKSATATVTLMPAVATGYTLSAVTIGGTSMKVSWTAPAGSSKSDHIVLTSPGAPDWWNLWSGTTNGATSGSFTVTAPSGPGLYEFRYCKGGGYTPSARSNILALNASGFSINRAPASIARNGNITVSWTAPTGRPGGWSDTIGLFQVGTASDQPISYIYPQGATSGTYTASAPGTAGSYEFRYMLAGDTYVTAFVSATVTVQ